MVPNVPFWLWQANTEFGGQTNAYRSYKGAVKTEQTTYGYLTNPRTGAQTLLSAYTTYTYYAKGGIANDPTGRSIFGEAGPEAAVPLPDGRTIPVGIS